MNYCCIDFVNVLCTVGDIVKLPIEELVKMYAAANDSDFEVLLMY